MQLPSSARPRHKACADPGSRLGGVPPENQSVTSRGRATGCWRAQGLCAMDLGGWDMVEVAPGGL